MSFILSEDAALKQHLSGIEVSDAKDNTRAVGVWFGQPDLEIREQSYPYITIQLTDVVEDFSRAHRGAVELIYTPEELATSIQGTQSVQDLYESIPESGPSGIPIPDTLVEYPIPMDIHYQIATYSRHPYHDRALIAALMDNKIKARFGFLHIPGDNTLRRMDLLGFVKRDVVEQDKRLFVNIFSVRVSSELFPTQLTELSQVQEVNVTYYDTVQQSITNP